MSLRPAHLLQPGLARITVEAADELTALAVAQRLIDRHNLTGASAPVPGARRRLGARTNVRRRGTAGPARHHR
ncbi:DUF6207 family protein [Streptomyces longispororuber]|uniref:DUF6207 family protein n=1 Tax=Streptomyces longispororuber TaxID=68230 RepID=UPI0036FEDE65